MDNIKNTNLIPPSPEIDVNTLRPFTRFCCSIGAIPSSYLLSMTYEEQLLWLCDYLQNTVIPTINNNGNAVAELQGLYIELKNYVDNYFTNLNVQQEINNKLDTMAQDGTLYNLMQPYLDTLTNNVNNNIDALNNKINTILSLTPTAVSSTSDMTDTTKLYLNTTDGYWYYYNGTSFVSGGVYQAPEILDNSVTPDKIYIKSFSKLKNIYDTNYFILNSSINGYKTVDNLKYIDISSGQPDSRKIIKFDLDGVTEIQFLYPYNSSQAWGRGYQITKENGEFVDNNDISTLYGNYTTITGNTHQYCQFNNETKLVTLDINSIRELYPQIKEIYLGIYEYPSWTITANAFINYYIPIENIKWLNLEFLPSKNYVNEQIQNVNEQIQNVNEQIQNIDLYSNYDPMSKSNLYEFASYGDSLTENGNGSTSFTDYLKNLIGNNNVNILNFGKSGQSSGTIAWRQGGLKITTNQEFNLPADTSNINIPISVSSGNILNFVGANSNLDCIINNIECTMSINTSDSTATISRKEQGNVINIPANTQILSTQNNYAKDVQIIWIGKNDIPNAKDYQITGVIQNIQSMINYLSPNIKRFIVLSIITSTSQTIGTSQYNTIMELNSTLQQNYPYNYLDIQNYLVNQCIYDMELTPTEEDLQDITNGTIPRQLLSDGVHPNPATREYIAKFIYNFLFDKGWIIK